MLGTIGFTQRACKSDWHCNVKEWGKKFLWRKEKRSQCSISQTSMKNIGQTLQAKVDLRWKWPPHCCGPGGCSGISCHPSPNCHNGAWMSCLGVCCVMFLVAPLHLFFGCEFIKIILVAIYYRMRNTIWIINELAPPTSATTFCWWPELNGQGTWVD